VTWFNTNTISAAKSDTPHFGDAGYGARVRFARLRRVAEQIAESVGLHARRAVVLIAGSGAVGVVGLFRRFVCVCDSCSGGSLAFPVELRARDRFSGRTPSGATIDLTCHW
jgi:hypothetical protein